MSNSIRTGASAPQTPVSESFFNRVKRVISETFNPPMVEVREPRGPDRYAETPRSVATTRRLSSVAAGYGTTGPTARRTAGTPVSDEQLVSFLDEFGRTGGPTRA